MTKNRSCLAQGAFALGLGIGIAAVSGGTSPFINGGATSFDPEISIVNSGAVLDVQGVVSADRKHVTLNMRPQLTSLLALREFTFQQGARFVGLPGGVPNGVAANATAPKAGAPAAPAPQGAPSILQRPGMTRVDNR